MAGHPDHSSCCWVTAAVSGPVFKRLATGLKKVYIVNAASMATCFKVMPSPSAPWQPQGVCLEQDSVWTQVGGGGPPALELVCGREES